MIKSLTISPFLPNNSTISAANMGVNLDIGMEKLLVPPFNIDIEKLILNLNVWVNSTAGYLSTNPNPQAFGYVKHFFSSLISSCLVLSCLVLSRLVLSYLVLSYLVLFYLILFCDINSFLLLSLLIFFSSLEQTVSVLFDVRCIIAC